jgi:hypothetical protein
MSSFDKKSIPPYSISATQPSILKVTLFSNIKNKKDVGRFDKKYGTGTDKNPVVCCKSLSEKLNTGAANGWRMRKKSQK